MRIVVNPYRRFGTTYRFHLRGPGIREEKKRFDSCPLQMGPIVCPEMSVRNYHYTLRNIPDFATFVLPRIAH